MKGYFFLVFVAMAALSWGAYVPTIHHGQLSFGGRSNPNSPMRAFLFVGLAYFLMAVVVPGIWLATHRGAADTGFNTKGVAISTIAGVLGALGALGVIFALKSGGKPLYVAPLVFAGAPIINVLVSMVWDRPPNPPQPLFYVGILMAAAGAALVLIFKPADTPHKPPAPAGGSSVVAQAPR
jgi:uncharacterized membrane protein